MLKSQVERLKFIRNVDIIVVIDIAKETHWARIISPYGLEFCKPFPINNNIVDFKLLEDKIRIQGNLIILQKYYINSKNI